MNNRAYHNYISLAAMIREQVAAHEAADEIVQGRYWENGKGCFIGCIAHGNSVSRVEEQTGFPVMLTRIAEGIFESLPNEIAKGFPRRVLEAPTVGADLSLVAWKFLHWLVSGVLNEFGTDNVRAACAPALDILSAKSRDAAADAAAAARAADAADAAARAAHTADAASAARAADAAAHAASAARAADAAAHAADAAARAAARAAYAAARAADAAYAAARIRQADKLVELLAEAK